MTLSKSLHQTGQRALTDPAAILTSIGEAVYDWDLLTDGLRWSPHALRLLGLDPDTPILTGHAYHEQTAPVSVQSRRDVIVGDSRSDGGGGVPYQVRYALQTAASGRSEVLWIDDTGRWFAGRDGRPERAHGVVRIAPGRGAGEPPPAGIDLDPLTGCFSRARLHRTLDAMFERRTARRAGFGLLLIGIEGLADLNRRHGYDAVDELVSGAAKALRMQIRSTDWLARYAGNKFALVLDHCDPAQIAPAAARTLDILMEEPLETSAGALAVRARIGGVLAPRHGRNVRALLLNAEAALQAAETSRAGFTLYDPAWAGQDDARRAEEMADEIVAALNDNRVRIAVQPIVAARSGEVAMSEALLRIVASDGQVLQPPAILPAAEKAGLMHLLDQRVLSLAVEHLRENAGTMTLNVSGASLRGPEWPARVAATARLNPGVANRLIFEIAEGAAAADLAGSVKNLSAVRELGVRVAVDHFGAGHTSLCDLRRLSPDFLKIDGAFVQNIARSPDDRFLVRSLIRIARHVGAPTVAEWVETPEAAATLRAWGVSYLQGTHFGEAEMPERRAAPAMISAVA